MFGVLHLFGRHLVTISLIYAFVSLGFAHKNVPTPMSEELAAYLAVGGSISDICSGDHEPQQKHSIDCEACRIADSFVILQGCKQPVSVELKSVQVWRFIAKRLSQSEGLDPARLTRAPPYV